MDNRRKWIIGIIALFMIVTIPHVAWYAGGFEPDGGVWLGWPYAVAVEAAIIIAAYFTKWQKTRVVAWVGYFAFVLASGIMNVGYIAPEAVASWTYAIFPTLAISLLGFLYRQVDSLVASKEGQSKIEPAHRTAVIRTEAPQAVALPEPEPTLALPEPHVCQWCQGEYRSTNALNAHKRFCVKKEVAESETGK